MPTIQNRKALVTFASKVFFLALVKSEYYAMADGGKIYLVSGQGQLTEMNESVYDSEEVLQNFLASYPDLLPGKQI